MRTRKVSQGCLPKAIGFIAIVVGIVWGMSAQQAHHEQSIIPVSLIAGGFALFILGRFLD